MLAWIGWTEVVIAIVVVVGAMGYGIYKLNGVAFPEDEPEWIE